MTRLLAEGQPGIEVSDIEGRLGLHPSYTFAVLSALEKERPGERLQLLIGGDSLLSLHEWAHASELAERYEILTYPRRGELPVAAELARFWPPQTVKKLLGAFCREIFSKYLPRRSETMWQKCTGCAILIAGRPGVWRSTSGEIIYTDRRNQ